ncbi:hypothetical protein B0T24DRAFT_724987 [Lasiosphaeria ovina]|uniref:Uncharacterized protein n=1 Tax=Lasiosphaeria ovina TaxID=92902 RepID=A0AAE0JTF4_9PEZI|nr:hypothetical protein B0T24DRAFT_724987 [Lasiosphaeria ovina]
MERLGAGWNARPLPPSPRAHPKKRARKDSTLRSTSSWSEAQDDDDFEPDTGRVFNRASTGDRTSIPERPALSLGHHTVELPAESALGSRPKSEYPTKPRVSESRSGEDKFHSRDLILPNFIRTPVNAIYSDLRKIVHALGDSHQLHPSHNPVTAIRGQLMAVARSCEFMNLEGGRLENQVAESESEIMKLKKELLDLRHKSDQNGDLKVEVDQLKHERDKLRAEGGELAEKYAKLEADYIRLEDQRAEAEIETRQLERLIQEHDAAKVSNPVLEDPPGALKEQRNSSQTLIAPPQSPAPTPYIKEEAVDEIWADGVQSADPTERLDKLCSGLASFLGKLFRINGRSNNEAIVEFVAQFGLPRSATPRTDATQLPGFWKVRESWSPARVTTMTPEPSLEGRFAQLCLLFPFLQNKDQVRPFQAIAELVTSLMSSDYSSSPQAAIAFVETMTSLRPTISRGVLSARRVLLATMVCELCRYIESAVPDAPRGNWNIGSILGPEAQLATQELPVGKLAAALGDSNRSSTQPIKDQLASGCGDQFCAFSFVDEDGKTREIGLLHCDESSNFLIIDFADRSFRLVDCQLASMMSNLTEPRKLDLIIERSDEKLLKMAAVPRDVAAFWLKYAMVDV